MGLLLLAAVALISLLLTAFGSGNGAAPVRTTAPAPATRLLPSGPPQPQVVAMWESLRLELPIAQGRVTAIGYHASGDGALAAPGATANPFTPANSATTDAPSPA